MKGGWGEGFQKEALKLPKVRRLPGRKMARGGKGPLLKKTSAKKKGGK